jgi:CheY-like chemotaxis protein
MRPNSTILVVDDDDDTRSLTGEYIVDAGYGCAQAESVVTAQKYLDYNVPALIVLDYHMPMVDGIELLKWLRTDPRFKKIPVLLVTGDPLIDLARVHALGANGFFLKGWMEWKDLMAEIARHVPIPAKK